MNEATNLADSTRKDKGTSRWFEAYPQAKEFAAYLSLGESGLSGLDPSFNFVGQSVTYIRSELVRQAEALGIPKDDLPSYDTVRRWLNTTPSSMRIYAEKGRRAYRDLVSPHLTRARYSRFTQRKPNLAKLSPDNNPSNRPVTPGEVARIGLQYLERKA
jgi:hypothetical protein